ncbi:hypothetical protein CQA62_01095 [Helicobacter cholecystus]|uniref:Uncharacterized protein n=1 Tax=Helicobacter cholecystus TaxID=45498 RepID=A0A3D8IYK1_9HELI|nr:hypothetical protein [Helicobacter cholecystus]RDU70040.1 hypothetical protein CQA62_01095 [Helicobacter cholecystus]VEJ24791.1 Uncharacterised protein [Helicobacter cholecystus]
MWTFLVILILGFWELWLSLALVAIFYIFLLGIPLIVSVFSYIITQNLGVSFLVFFISLYSLYRMIKH